MNAQSPNNGTDTKGEANEAPGFAGDLATLALPDVEAAMWLARRQDGLTPEEDAELQAWLSADPTRSVKLERLASVLNLLDDLPPEAAATLRATVKRHAPRAKPRLQRWQETWRPLLPQLALSGTAALVMAGGWLGWNHWQQQPTFMTSLATARGQQLTSTLPEGSTLHLDTATRLDVALYRQRREVRLPQGQALFNVAPDPARPFQVLAGPMRVTVLGTRFSVRYTHVGLGAGQVSVMVDEGHVKVTKAERDGQGNTGHELALDAGEVVELTAGQAVMADAQGRIARVTPTPGSAGMAWTTGRVVLDDTPLGDAVAEFERYVDTGLVVPDPDVARLRLNGSFDLLHVSAFKRALPQVLPVQLQVAPDGKTQVVTGN